MIPSYFVFQTLWMFLRQGIRHWVSQKLRLGHPEVFENQVTMDYILNQNFTQLIPVQITFYRWLAKGWPDWNFYKIFIFETLALFLTCLTCILYSSFIYMCNTNLGDWEMFWIQAYICYFKVVSMAVAENFSLGWSKSKHPLAAKTRSFSSNSR